MAHPKRVIFHPKRIKFNNVVELDQLAPSILFNVREFFGAEFWVDFF
jgi:hypothetical protein